MLDRVHYQRSHGAADVALSNSGVLGLRQAGSAKAMITRPPGAEPEIVFLNTSGGLTAGDRLDYCVTLESGCRAVATTQTAERAYRAEGVPARASVTLTLGEGAALDWLPQETILFDGAALHRETSVELGQSGRFLGIETVVLGRAAMGETVRRLDFRDRRVVRVAGRVTVLDPLRLDDSALARGDGQALLAGARAFAVLILVAPDAGDAAATLRDELTEAGVTGAISALPGRLVIRCHAPDAWPLRRQMIRLLARLRPGPMPRVWQL